MVFATFCSVRCVLEGWTCLLSTFRYAARVLARGVLQVQPVHACHSHVIVVRRCMSGLQRGRDHGLGLYNDVRAAYGLPRVQRFSEVSSPHAQLAPSPSNVTSTRALLRLPPTRHSLRSSLPSMVLMTMAALLLLLLQPTLQYRVSRAL